jgi:N-acetylneuraminate lyase
MLDSFCGIYPALLTPLNDHRKFVPKVAERLYSYLLSEGAAGAYVAGSTGEGPLLPPATRKAIVETLAPITPADKKLIVHVGSQDLRVAIDLAHHAACWGAHAVSSLPPAGEPGAVRDYYATLAKESPLPLILYYFPRAVPTAFRIEEELFEVCQLPNVLGVKFTDFNLYLLHRLVEFGKTVFNGYDEVLAAGLLMGAHGGIGSTYNIMPQLYVRIVESAREGDWESARRLQIAATRVIEVMLQFPFGAALRAVMYALGFDCGPSVKDPALSDAKRENLFIELDRAMTSELKSIIKWGDRVTTGMQGSF